MRRFSVPAARGRVNANHDLRAIYSPHAARCTLHAERRADAIRPGAQLRSYPAGLVPGGPVRECHRGDAEKSRTGMAEDRRRSRVHVHNAVVGLDVDTRKRLLDHAAETSLALDEIRLLAILRVLRRATGRGDGERSSAATDRPGQTLMRHSGIEIRPRSAVVIRTDRARLASGRRTAGAEAPIEV
jgi:hypothetical protein